MGTRSVITDQQGKYRIPALPGGTYTIDVSLEGFAPVKKTNVVLHVGTTVTVDIVMPLAKLEAEVTVIGEAPLIDVTDSSLAKTYLTKDLLENIPTVQNTFYIINLAPGVADWSAYGSGDHTGNSYQMDGVELVDAWFGGGIYTAPIDFNVIEESQVIALGAPAEYGNFTGAIVNVVTKSGGNTLSGDAQFLTRGKKWQSDNIDKNDPKWSLIPESPITNLYNANFHLGGPIIKDSLWFFSGYEYYKSTTEMKSANKTSPLTYPKYFFKLTFQPSENNRLQAFFEYHNRRALHASLSPLVSDEANIDLLYPVYVGNLSFLHTFSPKTLFEFKVAGYTMTWDSIPSSRDRNTPGHYDLATGEMYTNCYWWSHWTSKRLNLTTSFSHSVDSFIKGSHDFKLGFEVERAAGGGSYDFNGGFVYYDFYHQPYMAMSMLYREWAINWRSTFYAQDDWKVSNSLVLNPGLRYTVIRGSIPDLKQTVYKPEFFDPRFGFTWDIFKDHKTVLKAHYGMYHEGTKTYYFSMLTPMSDIKYYLVPEWGTLIDWFTIPGENLYSIDPNIKHPSMHMVVVGLEKVIGKDLSATVSFIYKNWNDFIESVNVTALFEKVPFIDPETGQVWEVYNQINPGEDHYYFTNPKVGKDIGAAYPDIVMVDPDRKYRGIEFSVNKRFSNNWQLYASYVYSKEEGSYSNSHTYTQSFNMGFATIYHDPTNQINLKGRSVISPPHVLKIQGTYVFPLDFSLSAYFSYISGQTWTRAVYVNTVDQPSKPYLLTEPMGSRRFPATKNLDLRVEKSLRYRNFRLSLMLDIFNVFNQGRETGVVELVGENFGKPTSVNDPRTFRASVRLWF